MSVEPLIVRDPEGEVLRMAVADHGEGIIDRACPCGGRVILGWVLDDDGRPIGSLPFMLHSAAPAPCDPFRSTSFHAFWTYLRTGTVPEYAPVMPSEPKPEKPRKATHR